MLKRARETIDNSVDLIDHMRELSVQTEGHLKRYNLRSVLEGIIVNISEDIKFNIEGNFTPMSTSLFLRKGKLSLISYFLFSSDVITQSKSSTILCFPIFFV